MADEPVHVAGYDPVWPQRSAEQRDQVAAILAPWLAAPIEHIGSTSVPGLPAEPVIDMLAPMRSLTRAQAPAAAIAVSSARNRPFSSLNSTP